MLFIKKLYKREFESLCFVQLLHVFHLKYYTSSECQTKNGRERKTRKSHIQHTPNYVIDQSIHILLDLAVLCCGIPITTNIFVLFNLQPHIIHIFTSLFLCVVIVFFLK